MERGTFYQFRFGLYSLLLITVLGTLGYMLLEDWSVGESLYMTIITISTTGFKEVKPLSPGGQAFTVVLIVFGIGTLAYMAGWAIQLIYEARLLKRRFMERRINKLSGHYIICGYGRMGTAISEKLHDAKVDFVVIENNSENLDVIISKGYLLVEGDATSDETLHKAGIERAKGLVSVLANDPENVYATLSAKNLNPQCYVVSRAIHDDTESKLMKAGADRVVKPYDLGGVKMAEMMLRPGVIDFIDVVSGSQDLGLNIEEICVSPDSVLVNKTLMELPLRESLNVIVVAIRRDDGELVYNPTSSFRIEARDMLIAIGEKSSLEHFNKVCFGQEDFEKHELKKEE